MKKGPQSGRTGSRLPRPSNDALIPMSPGNIADPLGSIVMLPSLPCSISEHTINVLGCNPTASSEQVESHSLSKKQMPGLPAHCRNMLHRLKRRALRHMPFYPDQTTIASIREFIQNAVNVKKDRQAERTRIPAARISL